MKYHVKMNCQNSVSDYTNLDSFIKEITQFQFQFQFQFQLINFCMTEKLAYKWIKQNGKLSKKKNIQVSEGELRVIGFRSEPH